MPSLAIDTNNLRICRVWRPWENRSTGGSLNIGTYWAGGIPFDNNSTIASNLGLPPNRLTSLITLSLNLSMTDRVYANELVELAR